MSDLKPGMALEEKVSSLYRALGYEVRRDVLLAGSQVDVLARKTIPGFGSISIAVEVKDHPGVVQPIGEVREFLVAAQALIGARECDRAAMVTTGTFTRTGKQLADAYSTIDLFTFADLERQLLASDEALSLWLFNYQENTANHRYVDLQATLLDVEAESDVEAPGRLAASQLLDLALANPRSALFLFGDYGAGKTTVLERLKALAIGRRQLDGNAAAPILVPLKNLTEGMDAEQLISLRLPTELGLTLPPAVFWDLHAAGRFILLLDGFDEITLRADAEKRTALLATLSPLLFGPSPAILSSRPSYFAKTAEYREALARLRRDRPRAGIGGDPGRSRVDSLTSRLTAQFRENGPTTPLAPDFVSYRLDPLTVEQIDAFLESSRDLLAASGVDDPSDVRTFLDRRAARRSASSTAVA